MNNLNRMNKALPRRLIGLLCLLCLCLSLATKVQAAELTEPYRLEDIKAQISLPEGWPTFTPETKSGDPGSDILPEGIDIEALTEAFEKSNIRLNAVYPDLSCEITVRVISDSNARRIFDYNRMDPSELESEAQAAIDYDYSQLTPGMSYSSFERYETDGLVFLRFLGSIVEEVQSAYFIQYNTIFNGVALHVSLHSFSGEVTGEQSDLLRAVVDSLHFDETLEPGTNWELILGIVALVVTLIGLGLTIRYFYRRHQEVKRVQGGK